MRLWEWRCCTMAVCVCVTSARRHPSDVIGSHLCSLLYHPEADKECESIVQMCAHAEYRQSCAAKLKKKVAAFSGQLWLPLQGHQVLSRVR